MWVMDYRKKIFLKLLKENEVETRIDSVGEYSIRFR